MNTDTEHQWPQVATLAPLIVSAAYMLGNDRDVVGEEPLAPDVLARALMIAWLEVGQQIASKSQMVEWLHRAADTLDASTAGPCHAI
ncbi:MAG: hypothetical protein AB7G25_11770 [Sphingomonadaceae bacterium]